MRTSEPMLKTLILSFLSATEHMLRSHREEHWRELLANHICAIQKGELRNIQSCQLEPPCHFSEFLKTTVMDRFFVYPQVVDILEQLRSKDEFTCLSQSYVKEVETHLGHDLKEILDGHMGGLNGSSLTAVGPSEAASRIYRHLLAIRGIGKTIGRPSLAAHVFLKRFTATATDKPYEGILAQLAMGQAELIGQLGFNGDREREYVVADVVVPALKYYVQDLAWHNVMKYGLHGLFVVNVTDQDVRPDVRSIDVFRVESGSGDGRVVPLFSTFGSVAIGNALENARQSALKWLREARPDTWQVVKRDVIYVRIDGLVSDYEGPSIGLPVAIAIVASAYQQPVGVKCCRDVAATGELGPTDNTVKGVGHVSHKIKAVVDWNRGNPEAPVRLVLVPFDNLKEAELARGDAKDLAVVGAHSLEDVLLGLKELGEPTPAALP